MLALLKTLRQLKRVNHSIVFKMILLKCYYKRILKRRDHKTLQTLHLMPQYMKRASNISVLL